MPDQCTDSLPWTSEICAHISNRVTAKGRVQFFSNMAKPYVPTGRPRGRPKIKARAQLKGSAPHKDDIQHKDTVQHKDTARGQTSSQQKENTLQTKENQELIMQSSIQQCRRDTLRPRSAANGSASPHVAKGSRQQRATRGKRKTKWTHKKASTTSSRVAGSIKHGKIASQRGSGRSTLEYGGSQKSTSREKPHQELQPPWQFMGVLIPQINAQSRA